MPSINILAIDGGGMMGVIPARILSYLDGSVTNSSLKTMPKSLASIPDIFGYVAGTSTGALLAVGLTVPPLSASQPLTGDGALDLYQNNASSIFPGNVSLFDVVTSSVTAFGNTSVICNESTKNKPQATGLASVIASNYGAPSWAGCYYLIDGIVNEWLPSSVGGGVVYNSLEGLKTPALNNSSSFVCLSDTNTTLIIPSFNGNLGGQSVSTTAFPPVLTQIDDQSVPWGPVIITNDTTVLNNAMGTNASAQNISVFQACLMTSACPMVLPPVPYDLQFGSMQSDPSGCNYFLDGGVWANNPTQAALLYVKQQNEIRNQNGEEPLTINCIVSIGCGMSSEPSGLDYATVEKMGGGITGIGGSGWLNYNGINALDATIASGASLLTSTEMGADFPNNYFRLDPVLPSGTAAPFWSNQSSTLANWVSAADSLVETWVGANNADSTWNQMITQLQKCMSS
ncbi:MULTISPECIES: patatin-like phospholipase family protein [unclassified Azospirillum]|uniref:patatin-like phospholipase family protein n=1 Tax=unclassified Azospirillum TaxID=2630922 RepID=UPI000B70CD52|nr:MULTISPECIES: patatin-like phospholipase family protein [unclassified Azospirillum]SNS51517.1 Patatin-like phospholipase [Azospirillum sp. RU38E]SNS70025.1 Patatin-like phospholipase [Azospirillum sp. RU37A]